MEHPVIQFAVIDLSIPTVCREMNEICRPLNVLRLYGRARRQPNLANDPVDWAICLFSLFFRRGEVHTANDSPGWPCSVRRSSSVGSRAASRGQPQK